MEIETPIKTYNMRTRTSKQIAEEIIEFLSGRFEYLIRPSSDFIAKLNCRIWEELIGILDSNFCEIEYYTAMFNLNRHYMHVCEVGKIRDFIRIYRLGNYTEKYSTNYSDFEATIFDLYGPTNMHVFAAYEFVKKY